MNKILLIFLFFLPWAAAKAQDKSTTVKHNTIERRIVSHHTDTIRYKQKTPDNLFFEKPEVVKVGGERPEHRWLFSLQGGMAHSFIDFSDSKNALLANGNNEQAVDDYIHKLQNGYQLNAGFHYLVASFFGIGLDYNLFYAASTGKFLSGGTGEYNLPVYAKSTLDERVYSYFAGASLLFQQFPGNNRKLKISETLSPGIVLFRLESRENHYQEYWGDNNVYGSGPLHYYDQVNSLAKSTPLGIKGCLSVDYAITPQLSAGIAGEYLWSKLHKITTKDATTAYYNQKLAQSFNISHLGYGLIVRYNF